MDPATVGDSLQLPTMTDLMDYTETATGVEGIVSIKAEQQLESEIKTDMTEESPAAMIAEESEKLHATVFNGLVEAVSTTTPTTTNEPCGATTAELKQHHEELFIMMETGDFGMKKLEQVSQFHMKAEPTHTTFNSTGERLLPVELKQDLFGGRPTVPEEDSDATEADVDDESESGADGQLGNQHQDGEMVDDEEEMCVITTKMCDIEDVPLVCQCMGRLAGFWSYMYRECSYLLLKRIDQFFLSGVILLKCEYEWLVRAIQAVYALGEVPFREFSAHVDKLHVTITPDWVAVQLNVSDLWRVSNINLIFQCFSVVWRFSERTTGCRVV